MTALEDITNTTLNTIYDNIEKALTQHIQNCVQNNKNEFTLYTKPTNNKEYAYWSSRFNNINLYNVFSGY